MRILLLSGHPGHELRVHRWLCEHRPWVMVLTRGTSWGGIPTLTLSERIFTQAGAPLGPIFGRFADKQVYDLLLERKQQVWHRLVREIADWVHAHHIDVLVGDAREGYCPTHDLCRTIQNAVVGIINQERSTKIQNWQYNLADPANGPLQPGDQVLTLSNAELAQKISAAESFRHHLREFGIEEARGLELHRREILSPADSCPFANFVVPPRYETFGRQRVAAGIYQNHLTYRDHLRPVEEALASLSSEAA